MPDEEERTGLVVDNGTFNIKAGFTGDMAPRSVFRTVVGRARHPGIAIAMGVKDALVGTEAVANRGTLNMKEPVVNGLITDWANMENVWHHTFYEALKVPPEEHPVLMTDPPLNSREGRENMTTMLFETFNIPAMYIGVQAVVGLYASGRTTGSVLDLGHGKSHTVPIFEGYALPHSIDQLEFAGKDLTDLLHKLLVQKGYGFTTMAEYELVRMLKEKFVYVAEDYAAECARCAADPRPVEKKYALPDGSILYLAKERFECAEALFQPSVLGKEGAASVASSLVNTIKKCESDIRKVLSSNIVLCGGSTMFPNLEGRLIDSIQSLAPAMEPKIIAQPERKYTVWIGGSILSSLSTFAAMWVTKDDFEENGASVVHRKCF